MPASLSDSSAAIDQRWRAVCERDARQDGAFVYGVATTGIYCRPSCVARKPLRRNVRFFSDGAQAQAAGFRACLRCRPDALTQAAALVARACRLIAEADETPDVAALAQALSVSVTHFHRVFRKATGLTPHAYAAGVRAERARQALHAGQSVTEAAFEAGFRSASRFHAQSQAMLGMPARRFRAGGAGEQIRFALAECALGALLVAASSQGVCAIALGDTPEELLRELQENFGRAELVGDDRGFGDWIARIVAFVEAPAQGLELPLDLRGTAFQLRVWACLRAIPPGQTLTYSDVAQRIGAPAAVRAVASACAANRLALAVPCHRVVRLDGSLSGYRWGLARKHELLVRETAGPKDT